MARELHSPQIMSTAEPPTTVEKSRSALTGTDWVARVTSCTTNPIAGGEATDSRRREREADMFAAAPRGLGAHRDTQSLVKAPAVADLQALAVHAGPDSLPFYAAHHLDEGFRNGSPHTLDAKSRDLKIFIAWFARATGTLAARAWRPRDSRSFVAFLLGQKHKPATVNRRLATLRTFASWMHRKHWTFGTAGLPTDGVKDIACDELPCRKLSDEEIAALIGAAKALVCRHDTKRASAAKRGQAFPEGRVRHRRNLAILAALYYGGLRATECAVLTCSQYSGAHFIDVARKGQNVTPKIFVAPEGRRYLDDYLSNERKLDALGENSGPLFVSSGRSKSYLSRSDLYKIVKNLAAEANKHRPPHKQIHVSPHAMRHSFGWKVRQATGSDFETAVALGHRSLANVGRYSRPTDEERESVLETALRFGERKRASSRRGDQQRTTHPSKPMRSRVR